MNRILLFAPLFGLGCQSALVGGTCLEGFVQRGHDCVETPADSGSSSSAGGTGGAGGASSVGGAGGLGAASGTGGSMPTTSTATGTISSGGGGSGCGTLTTCGDGCFDLETDPFHCGSCDGMCSSGVCVAGECQGTVAGHVVVLAVDFSSVGSGSATSRLLGNATFLSTHAPLRVLDYRALSNPTEATHIATLLSTEATSRGKTLSLSATTDPNVVTQGLSVSTTDVLLIHVPLAAEGTDLEATASAWATPLDHFGKTGGVVVVVVEKNTPSIVSKLLDGSGLMPGVTTAHLTSGPFEVDDFLDSITAGIPSPFGGLQTGVALTFSGTTSSTLSIPVVDGDDSPIAFHRVIPPQ